MTVIVVVSKNVGGRGWSLSGIQFDEAEGEEQTEGCERVTHTHRDRTIMRQGFVCEWNRCRVCSPAS